MATNLGIATVSATLYNSAPYINKNPRKYNFDISAYNWDVIKNSPYIAPLLAEYVEDNDGTFAAIFPSKRKNEISNYFNTPDGGDEAANNGMIKWKVLGTPPKGIATDIVNKGGFDTYSVIQPNNYGSLPPPDYKGPLWWDDAINRIPPPNDRDTIDAFFDLVNANDDEGDSTSSTTTSATDTSIPKLNCIWQSVVRDGLWWAVESDAFLSENMPFWVSFYKMNSPSSSDHETCFVISMGESEEQRFDIYISMNNKPRVIDHLGAENTPGIQKEWENDRARVLPDEGNIEVGIMTIAGRLVVSVNKEVLVYTRINRKSGEDGGKLMECKIPAGKIRVFGTNVQTRINTCPMSFAQMCILALPLPTIIDEGGSGTNSNDKPTYQGCNNQGLPSGSVAELPTPPSVSGKLYGVDCKEFTGDGGSCSPNGIGFHKLGTINFALASESVFSSLPSTDFYTLVMQPGDIVSGAGLTIPYGGAPYFFRLKGVYSKAIGVGGVGTPLDDYIVSVDETATAPDYFHVKKNASITLYNENNIIGSKVLTNQTAISINWGWDGESTKTFTGIVVSINKSEVPGRESITLNCEDYIYILNNSMILNSPFYDGMVAYYAIKDLAERSGVTTFVKDWESENDYFLPSGYAFSQPKMRWNPTQKIFECMMDMTKRFEAYIYFDGDGVFHINKPPGGILSPSPSEEEGDIISFSSDPASGANYTILDERNVEINYDSTVNCISAFTVERDTRNAVLYSKTASGSENKLTFLKVAMIDQAACGELEVLKGWVNDIAKRTFFPILKTRFKTSGTGATVLPLSFITVDGHMFRVMSVKRNFNAETNDLNSSYECEWLWGG